MAPQSWRQVSAGIMSRWKVSPLNDRVTAPLELISHKSNPSCFAMGRANVCRRP